MAIFWANLLSLSILLVFMRSRWLRTRSVIDPGILFAANLMVLYPIRGLTLYLCRDTVPPNYPELLLSSNLEHSSWLAALGCVGFVCGYALVIGRRKLALLRAETRKTQSDDLLVCWSFFVASLIGMAFKIATGDYISYLTSHTRIVTLSQIGTLLTDLQWPAFIGAWVLWFRGERKPGFVAFFVCIQCVVIPFQFIQGSKTFLSLLVVSIVLAYYWSRARLPKFTALAAIVFVAFFVFPYVQTFREFINTKYGRIPTWSALDFQGFKAYSDDDSDSPKENLISVSSRYGGIDELYNITQVVPTLLPYRLGSEYSAFFVNLVPRALWPEKPVFSRGAAYGTALNTITSVTPFPFGEAYWDLGLPGLLLSMTLWGMCLAGLARGYERLYQNPHLSFFIGIYFLSQLYWITGGESSMPVTISGIPQQTALLLSVYLVLRSLRPSQQRERLPLRGAA